MLALNLEKSFCTVSQDVVNKALLMFYDYDNGDRNVCVYMNKLAGQCGFPSLGELARAQALSSY